MSLYAGPLRTLLFNFNSNNGLQAAHQTASAYVESLNDQQLASLVEMLDEKEKTM